MDNKYLNNRLISFLLIFIISFGQVSPVFAVMANRREEVDQIEKTESMDEKDLSQEGLVRYEVRFLDKDGKKKRDSYIGEGLEGTLIRTRDKTSVEMSKASVVLGKKDNIIELTVKDMKAIDKLVEEYVDVDYLTKDGKDRYIFNRYALDYLTILDYNLPSKEYSQYKIDTNDKGIEKIDNNYYKNIEKNTKGLLEFIYTEKNILVLEQNIDVKLRRGLKKYELPQDILVSEEDKSSRMNVEWDTSKVDTSKLGKYEINGKLVDKNNKEIKDSYEVPILKLEVRNPLSLPGQAGKDIEIRGYKAIDVGSYRVIHFYKDPKNINDIILLDQETGKPGIEESDIKTYNVEVGEHREEALKFDWLKVKNDQTISLQIEKGARTDFKFEYEPIYRIVLMDILRLSDNSFKIDERLNQARYYLGSNEQDVEIHRSNHPGFILENRPTEAVYRVRSNDQGKYLGADGNTIAGTIEGFDKEKHTDDIVLFYIFSEDMKTYEVEYQDEYGNVLKTIKDENEKIQVGKKVTAKAENTINIKNTDYILNDLNNKSLIIDVDEASNKIVFRYKKSVDKNDQNRVNYLVKHIDEDGDYIISPFIFEGQVGDIVVGDGPFDWESDYGYRFIKSTPQDATIELEKDAVHKNEIIYSYSKVDKGKEEPEDPKNPEKPIPEEDLYVKYNIHFETEKGKELIAPRVEEGKIGSKITVNGNVKELKDEYVLKGYKVNDGMLELGNSYELELVKGSKNKVTFVYDRASTKYKVKYVDEDGNIIEEYMEDGLVGKNTTVTIPYTKEFIDKDGEVYILNDLNEKSKILLTEEGENIFQFRYKKATEEKDMGNYQIKYVYKDEAGKLVNIISPFVLEGRVGYKISILDDNGKVKGIIDFTDAGYKYNRVEPTEILIEKRGGISKVNEIIYYYDLMDKTDPEYPESGREDPKDPQDPDIPGNIDEKVFVNYVINHIDKDDRDKHLADISPGDYVGKENTTIIANSMKSEDLNERNYEIDDEKNKEKELSLKRNENPKLFFEYVKGIVEYKVLFTDEEGNEIKETYTGHGRIKETVQYITDNIIDKDGEEYILKGKNEARITLSEDNSKNIIKYMYKKALTEDEIRDKEGKYLVRHVYQKDGKYIDIVSPVEFTEKIMTIVEGKLGNSIDFKDFKFTKKIVPISIVVSENVKEIKYIYEANDKENPPMGPEENNKKKVDYMVKYTADGKPILDGETYKIHMDMSVTKEGPKYLVGNDDSEYELINGPTITKLIQKQGEIIEFKYKLVEKDPEKPEKDRIGHYRIRHIDEEIGSVLSETDIIEGRHGDIVKGKGNKTIKGYEFTKAMPENEKITIERGEVKEIVYLYKNIDGKNPEKPEGDKKTDYKVIYKDEQGRILSEKSYEGIVGITVTTLADKYFIKDEVVYELEDKIASKDIILKATGNEVIFNYKTSKSVEKDKAYYMVRYINEKGQDLIEAIINVGYDKSVVTGKEKTIKNYKIIDVSPKNGKLILERGKIKEIIFTYKWLDEDIEEPESPNPKPEDQRNYYVKYEYYKNGSKIGTESDTMVGILGSEVTVVGDFIKEFNNENYRIEGYNRETIEIKDIGNIITFKYNLVDGSLEDEGGYIARHVNEKGIDIVSPEYLTAKIGTVVKAKEKSIKGYQFLKVVPNNKSITVGEELQEIVFTYKWMDTGEEPEEPGNEEFREYIVTYKSKDGETLKPEYRNKAILGSSVTEYTEEILIKDEKIYKIIDKNFIKKTIEQTNNRFDFVYEDITNSFEDGMGYYRIIHQDNKGKLILDSGLLEAKVGTRIKGQKLDIKGYELLSVVPESETIEVEENKIVSIKYIYKKTEDKPEEPKEEKTEYSIRYVDSQGNNIISEEKSEGIIGYYITSHADYKVKGSDGKTYILDDSSRKTIKLNTLGNNIVFKYKIESSNIDEDMGYYMISHIYENGMEIKTTKLLSDKHGTVIKGSPIADKTLIRTEPESGFISVDKDEFRELVYIYKYNDEDPGGNKDQFSEYYTRYKEKGTGKVLGSDGPVVAQLGSRVTREAPAFLENTKYRLEDTKTKTIVIKGINNNIDFEYVLVDDFESNKDKGKYIVRYVNEEGIDIAKSVVAYGKVNSTILADSPMKIKDYEYINKTVPEGGQIVLDKENIKEIVYIYKWKGGGNEPEIPSIDPEIKDKIGYSIRYVDKSDKDIATKEDYIGIVGTMVKTKSKEISGYRLSSSDNLTIELTNDLEKNTMIFKYDEDYTPGPGPNPDPNPTPDPNPNPTPNPDPGPGPIKPEKPIQPENPIPPEIDDNMLNKEDHFAYIQGYTDDTVKPEGYLTREEAATVFYRLIKEDERQKIETRKHNFPDIISGRWSEKEIATLVNAGILNGYTDGTFKPQNRITRAELAKIVVEFDELVESDENLFIDIKDHWAKEYINSAAKNEWIEGYPTGEFKPQNYITRAEFVTMVNRVLDRVPTVENMLPNRLEFKDLNREQWYYAAMQEAINSHDYERDNNRVEKWTKLAGVF